MAQYEEERGPGEAAPMRRQGTWPAEGDSSRPAEGPSWPAEDASWLAWGSSWPAEGVVHGRRRARRGRRRASLHLADEIERRIDRSRNVRTWCVNEGVIC